MKDELRRFIGNVPGSSMTPSQAQEFLTRIKTGKNLSKTNAVTIKAFNAGVRAEAKLAKEVGEDYVAKRLARLKTAPSDATMAKIKKTAISRAKQKGLAFRKSTNVLARKAGKHFGCRALAQLAGKYAPGILGGAMTLYMTGDLESAVFETTPFAMPVLGGQMLAEIATAAENDIENTVKRSPGFWAVR